MSLVQAVTAQPHIAAAIQQASARTGADFNYLLNTAMRESSLNCSAKSNTSTACGLFQFTEQTWLGTMKQDGAALGLGQYANAISQNSRGRYTVTDPAARQAILALRNDPKVSSLMAGAYTSNSQSTLEQRLGRSVNSGELYIAHFLGAAGATKLISAAEEAPGARADVLFPAAAAANRSIFYDGAGAPRTVAQVYQNLVAKHQGTAGPRFEIAPSPQLADAGQDTPVEDGVPAGSDNVATSVPMTTAALHVSGRSYASAGLPGFSGRSQMTLSPAVVQILASLDAPGSIASRASSDPQDDRAADDRKVERRLLPRGGLALG